MHDNETLVVPTQVIDQILNCQPWQQLADIVHQHHTWMPRAHAEADQDYVQLIPCATLQNRSEQLHLFQRCASGYDYLSDRLSIIIGGHCEPGDLGANLLETLHNTMTREILEEVGINPEIPDQPTMAVRFGTSGDAAQHMALIYPVSTDLPIQSVTPDEFTEHAGSISKLLSAAQIHRDHFENLDPWSKIIVAHQADKA